MIPVNSYNEWDPLREVIVGAGVPDDLPAIDFTFKLFFHDNIYGKHVGEPDREYITKKCVEEHNEDIENFVELLKDLDVTVRRPKIPSTLAKVKTPNWSSTVHPSLNCRDLTIIIGNTIIETPPVCRWRYYENDYLKHLFLEYFKEGAKWVTAPKPLLLDTSFDIEYFRDSHPEIYNEYNCEAHSHMSCGNEIMFDAANCMRLGKHILMNVSNKNQQLGAQWLRDTIGDKYTVWEANICDNHIDSEFLPIRPGLALLTLPDIKDKLPPELQSWDFIYVPEIYDTINRYKASSNVPLASPKIDYNILSITPNTIICNSACTSILERKLKPYNVDVISSNMRHANIFAGGHHCITLDIYREGILENYF